MITHRVIRSRPIPVRSIEDLRRNTVSHLQQSAGVLIFHRIASNYFTGYLFQRRHFFALFNKRSLQILLTQADDRVKGVRAANSTGFSINNVHWSNYESILRENYCCKSIIEFTEVK